MTPTVWEGTVHVVYDNMVGSYLPFVGLLTHSLIFSSFVYFLRVGTFHSTEVRATDDSSRVVTEAGVRVRTTGRISD